MKRLRELPASSRLIERAQRMIDAAPPIPESSATMQRIRRALDQPRSTGSSVLLRAPAFALAAALLLFGASAFAAVRTWVERLVARPPAAAIDVRPQLPGARAPETHQQLLAAEASAHGHEQTTRDQQVSAGDDGSRIRARPTREAPAQLTAADERVRTRAQSADAQKSDRSSQRHSARRLARSPASPASAPPTSALAASQAAAPPTAAEAASQARGDLAAILEPARLSHAAKRSSDSELVVRAVQMLRRDHDPALASRLLERYRERNPAGVLAEEVLSLQIEAAVAAEDPRANSLAREYLARYPDGRYRERAASALGGVAP